MKKQYGLNAIVMAITAAILYGLVSPISKLLLKEIPPTLLASLLYLGAGFGMLLINLIQGMKQNERTEAKITKKELPYTFAMILLDIAAPIFLMIGLARTTSANAALLNNFEIVVTAIIALFIFKETVGRRMWIAITLITLSSILLSVKDFSGLHFTYGSIFILLGCVCWGFENNCTRMLSIRDPLQIVVIKGFGSGFGALLISLVNRQYSMNVQYIILTMVVGFFAFGLSIYFYIYAQRELGAARTSTYYATSPFIGVIISWIVFRDEITGSFLIALAIMLVGTFFAVSETHNHTHIHQQITHEHKHNHCDGHHNHIHEKEITGEHCHKHTHEALSHQHKHTPDLHHSHEHNS